MKTKLFIFALACLCRNICCGQSLDTVLSQQAMLTVHSNVSGVKVISDSTLLGISPVDSLTIPSGTHVFRYIHPDIHNWLLPAKIETILVHPSEHIVRSVDFPAVYQLYSEPSGAIVRHNDSIIGQTPLLIALSSSHGILNLSKTGYSDVQMPLPSEGGSVFAVLPSNNERVSPFVDNEQIKNLTPVYLTSGAAVVSGAIAAYFKIKADNMYTEYRGTGDPGILAQVRRYDTVSGIALSASEVSLFMLSYFLLSR